MTTKKLILDALFFDGIIPNERLKEVTDYLESAEPPKKQEMKLGQTPAFAVAAGLSREEDIYEAGISKRFYAACAAMSGILSNEGLLKAINQSSKDRKMDVDTGIVIFAYRITDELLKQENE